MPNASFDEAEFLRVLHEHEEREKLERMRLWPEKLHSSYPFLTGTPAMPNPPQITPQVLMPSDIIDRLLGPQHRFMVRTYTENWDGVINSILHIALCDRQNHQIVRFEEDPATFPSDRLIDALRLLR